MKNFEEKAIPLIFRRQDKKYEANPQALAFFGSIEGKIAVISVAGVYRTGKSYLLNTILLKQKSGFAVGPTTNPKTKGIWVWGKPLILKNEKDQIINVCVLDSEGLGSTEEDVNHDLRLFSLTLLLSSMFIYNTLGSIDQQAIDSLGLVLRLCERMRSESSNDFPDFYWVLRDFSLALVGKDNQPLTPNKYLEQALSPQAGDSEVRNKIRQSIRSSFEHRSCFTFVRPLTNEEELQKLDRLEVDQLRPEFFEQVLDFRKLINSRVRTKRIKGKEITAEMLVELIKVYTREINGDNLPQIETGWKYVCARQCEQAIAFTENKAEQLVSQLLDSLPASKRELAEKREELADKLKKIFEARTAGNDQASSFSAQIPRIIDRLISKVEGEMRVRNSQETKAFIKREFDSVERRLKAGEIKGMGQLAKEFQIFYEFYRKKCPFKDQIQTGLEAIMKKFSDCSLILFKTIKKRKDEEISKLRQDIERAQQEQQLKEERQKHEKNLSSEKMAVLESKIEEISRENSQLSKQLTHSEIELQKIRREAEEKSDQASQNLQIELIEIRKKLINAEDQIKESGCRAQFELNNVRNQLFLKENQVTHMHEEREELAAKIQSLSSQLTFEKEERGKRIEQLIASSQSSRSEWQGMRKAFEERLTNREQQILRLESSLEAKVAELGSIRQQHEKAIKNLLESHESDKQQIVESQKEEIKELRETLQSEEEGRNLSIKKMEADFSQKELDLKMHRLEVDRQMALLNQKIEFVRKECSEKEQKIAKLQEENSCYLAMLENKDNEINTVNSILDESRFTYESEHSESSVHLERINQELRQKTKELFNAEQNHNSLKAQLRQKSLELKNCSERIQQLTKSYEGRIKELSERLTWTEEQYDRTKLSLETEIEQLKTENTKGVQEQKKTAELSLVQLKNYYEMEKERLEKRNLQERKKHQNLKAALTSDLEGKHRKIVRALQEQLQAHKIAKEQLEEQLVRVESQWEVRLNTQEEEREHERRLQSNRIQLLERKYAEIQNQLEQLDRTYDEERIGHVKRIEGLNFELSRKEKELLQVSSKKEGLEQTVLKKESQLDGVKRLMNQQIEAALKKTSETQSKYQKVNEEYMQYKIQTEKELALIRQKNQFQANKLSQITRDKQVGPSKNIQRLEKQRFGDLKDLNQKLKAEILALEGQIETTRKAHREQETNYKKQVASLERDYQFLFQKESIAQSKISELESRVSLKTDSFNQQIQELRAKVAAEREKAMKEKQDWQNKWIGLEDEKNQLIWNNQKETALLTQKINYVEYQKDQIKKQLEDCERKLGVVTVQLRKASEKASDDNQFRKYQNDKKYQNQIETLKETLKSKSEAYEDQIRKLKDQLWQGNQKIAEANEKIKAHEMTLVCERKAQQELSNLKREKEGLNLAYRNERQRESQQWKKKNGELEKRLKELEKNALDQVFQLEKDHSKWEMERQNLCEKIKALEDTLDWERNKTQLVKSKNEKKGDRSSQFSFSEYSRFSSGLEQ